MVDGFEVSMERDLFDRDHEILRTTVRGFAERFVTARLPQWEASGIIDKSVFRAAGAQGLLGLNVPEEYGGGGTDDFRFNVVINEELVRADALTVALSITVQNDIVTPYFLSLANVEQRERWLPQIASGEAVLAIAMTEPDAGSDLAHISTTACHGGSYFIVNGTKSLITNGINADLILTVVRTNPSPDHHGLSLLVIEDGMEGFVRGRNLPKIGLHAQDTSSSSTTSTFPLIIFSAKRGGVSTT